MVFKALCHRNWPLHKTHFRDQNDIQRYRDWRKRRRIQFTGILQFWSQSWKPLLWTPLTGQLDGVDKCNSTLSQVFQPAQSEPDFLILAFIIGTPFLASLFLVLISAVVFRKSCNTKKKIGKARADVNPVYEGATDYEYDEMVTYDSTEVIMKGRSPRFFSEKLA